MNPTFAIVLASALAFLIVAGLGMVFASGDPSRDRVVKRAQAIGADNRDGRRARGPGVSAAEMRRRQLIKGLKEQEQQKRARLTLASKLQQAGLESHPFAVLGLGVGGGLLAFGILFCLRINVFVAVGVGFAAALGAPLWVLDFLAKRRTNKFTLSFADAMDIIVRGIKSGLAVHDCLKIIASETPQPLRGEFARLVENIGMGMTLDQGLDKMCERMPTPEARFFSIVMNIQQKTGGNLAEALGNLSTVLRSRKLMREKIKALSSEATTSALIIGAMPPGVVLLIMITSPAYMNPMFQDHRGWLMLGGSAIWMGIGIFVMARMINFKF